VAIATRSIPFINTICFNQVLNRLWYDHLDGSRLGTVWGTCKFTIHIATFGFLAPIYLDYRSVDKIQKQVYKIYFISVQVTFCSLLYSRTIKTRTYRMKKKKTIMPSKQTKKKKETMIKVWTRFVIGIFHR
jgi:hypothetical protein